ncbi:hypothetical protein ABI59_11435 [Acidobacteria bacterium Mor1]|nr:hypothetical protein ABI59_11435 [Acidobacteria bacterium Mor1]
MIEANRGQKPRVLTPFQLKWMLSLYPPLFWARVRVREFAPDFRYCRAEVKRSFLTRNFHGTTFGGAIFSGGDPFHAILYWQSFAREGLPVQTWLKSANIDYKKPAASTLTLEFRLSERDLDDARRDLDRHGRHVRTHQVDAVDQDGRICAVLRNEVYMRYPRDHQPTASAF